MKYLNYSFTGVNTIIIVTVFKYFKSLDFGLLQWSPFGPTALVEVSFNKKEAFASFLLNEIKKQLS
ncbi:MAG: hypothetical protein WCP69_11265 [Bacteroidota bacterium]